MSKTDVPNSCSWAHLSSSSQSATRINHSRHLPEQPQNPPPSSHAITLSTQLTPPQPRSPWHLSSTARAPYCAPSHDPPPSLCQFVRFPPLPRNPVPKQRPLPPLTRRSREWEAIRARRSRISAIIDLSREAIAI